MRSSPSQNCTLPRNGSTPQWQHQLFQTYIFAFGLPNLPPTRSRWRGWALSEAPHMAASDRSSTNDAAWTQRESPGAALRIAGLHAKPLATPKV